MPRLKYNGPLPNPEVEGFGHFTPGEEKLVDAMTALSFRDARCVAKGWEVIDDAPAPATENQTTTGTPTVEEVAPEVPARRSRRFGG